MGELYSLNDVSSATATSCAAVGGSALPERWDGSRWSLAPISASTSASYLDSVACPTPTSCFAVGTAGSLLDESNNTLVEHWDGTGWSVVPSPTPSGTNVHAALSSISCPSPSSCTAVGSYDLRSLSDPNAAVGKSLIEHWNGTSWALVASPTPPNANFWSLSSVSCAAVTSCNAVGSYGTPVGPVHHHLLAEHWNGARWSVVAMPSPSGAVLNGVSCSSVTGCFAVGGRNNAKSSGLAMAERWNGKSWSIVPTPVPKSGTFFQLNSVWCRADADCTAVGFSSATSFVSASQRVLVEHWNGKKWLVEASPSPVSPNGLGMALNAVSCSSAASCTAVGNYDGTYPNWFEAKPLIEEWNGAAWSIVPSPIATGATSTFLNGVTCPSPATCTAVGGWFSADGLFTLAERGT